MATTTFWKSKGRPKSLNNLPNITGKLQLERKVKTLIQQRAQWLQNSFWIEVYRTLKTRICVRSTTSFWKARRQKLKTGRNSILQWSRNNLWLNLLNTKGIRCSNFLRKPIISWRSKLIQIPRRGRARKKMMKTFLRSSFKGLQQWILTKQLDSSWGEIQNLRKVRSPNLQSLLKHSKQSTRQHQRTLAIIISHYDL